MKVYQSNIYRKELNWQNFDDEPGVQEKHQMKAQQSYIPSFVAYLTYAGRSQEHQLRHDVSNPCKTTW